MAHLPRIIANIQILNIGTPFHTQQLNSVSQSIITVVPSVLKFQK